MYGKDFREALADKSIRPHPVADEEDILLEKWNYPPALLSDSPGLADPLSVFLSLRDDPDERVQAALQHLLEAMPW
jgi:hypothetical protein